MPGEPPKIEGQLAERPTGEAKGTREGGVPVFTSLSECQRLGHYSWVPTRLSLIPVLGCDHFTITLASLRGNKETPQSHSTGPPSKCYSGLRITLLRQVAGNQVI